VIVGSVSGAGKRSWIRWLPAVYFAVVLAVFLPRLFWGNFGVVRPGDIVEGMIDMEVATALINGWTRSFQALFGLMVVGFVLCMWTARTGKRTDSTRF